MTGRLRVYLLAANPEHVQSLTRLVGAAGHQVSADAPDVVLAEAEALSMGISYPALPVVALGEAEGAPAGLLAPAPSARQLDAALRAAASGLIVRAPPRRDEAVFRAEEDVAPLLTPREVEVLAAIALGLSNKEVARRLGISAHTVKFHLEAAFRKLGASSRAEAVAKGLRRQLIEV